VLAIYKHYVDHTIISFEYEAPSFEEYVERIKTNTSNYPWLVCSCDNKIIGFAYGSTHRYRTAYQWSPESTIYIAPDFHTKGIGRILYETLFSLLKLQGYYNVFAGVALPNEKSIGFHLAIGFEEIGIFKKVGYKHGNWHDTHWFQLNLTKNILNPSTPKSLNEVAASSTFQTLLTTANERIKNIR
ncbi:MAG: N-acetyltransferase, partial [Bacteroidetes bacterium]|nr:N-acetyltransferase [Bacteroidota bacterium]